MDISSIKHLIAQGKLREAFETGEANPQLFGKTYMDELLLLKSQFRRLEKEQRLNLREGTIELNQVIHGYLELLNEIRNEGSSNLTNASSVLAINEARLLYEFNKPFFQYFQGVAQQIEGALANNNLPANFPQTIRESLEQLTQLKKQIKRVEALAKNEKTKHGEVELVTSAEEAIAEVQIDMKIPEIKQKQDHLATLERDFKKNNHQQRLPAFIITGFMLLIATLIIIVVIYMVMN